MRKGAGLRPLFRLRFVVVIGAIGYKPLMMVRAQNIVLTDRVRLPWRFFGRMTAAVQAGL